MSAIPWQIRRDDLLFVLLPRGEKGLQTRGWNLVENGRRYDDLDLLAHLKDGGNYGFYPAPGSPVLLLDVDDADRFHAAGGTVGNTFGYSAWPDLHKYRAVVTCTDYPRAWDGRKTSIAGVLEIFFPAGERDGVLKAGGQCVGPGSLHPNGNVYEVVNDAPIRPIRWSDLLAVADRICPNAEVLPARDLPVAREPASAGKKLLRDRYDLQPEWPLNPYPAGDEIRGASPFHDSTTGSNVAVNLQKGVFYCFRHGVGYDAAGCEAIRRGIIECGEPFTREAFLRLAGELEQDFPEVRYMERVEYRRKMQAARREAVRA